MSVKPLGQSVTLPVAAMALELKDRAKMWMSGIRQIRPAEIRKMILKMLNQSIFLVLRTVAPPILKNTIIRKLICEKV